jgi:hypothetical protein
MTAQEWLRFVQRKRREDDFAAEAQAYLEEETARNLEAGMDLEEAAAAARRKFGNVTAIREIERDTNIIGFFESFWQDLSYGARQLRSNPGFFVVAVLSLALGIGANAAIFHLLDALRLRSLPVKSAQQLAQVQIAENEHCCNGNFTARHSDLTYPAGAGFARGQFHPRPARVPTAAHGRPARRVGPSAKQTDPAPVRLAIGP